mmetsp:Transcript_7162/g.20799  ORF Transcript_7162/g.20799 Transcript_7162/m.20799 type:complete len:461 (+) Transcript_7162:354-1736(+)
MKPNPVQSSPVRSIVPFQQTGVTEAAVGTGGNQGKSLPFLLQPPRRGGDQSRPRGTKRMPNRQGPSLGVHPVDVNGTDLGSAQLFLREFVAVHGRQIRQNLPRKGFVDLKYPNVVDRHVVALHEIVRAVRGSQQQFLPRIAGSETPVPQVGPRLVSQFDGLFLAHDETGGGAVRQVARVGGRVRSVGLDKGRLELAHGFHRRIPLDAVFLRRSVVGEDFALVESVVVRLVGQGVGPHREFVLLLPRDAKLGRELVRTDPHDLSRRVVGNRGGFQAEVLRRETPGHVPEGPEGPALFHGLGERDEFLSDRPRQADGNVREGLDATRDDDIGVPRLDRRGARGNGGIGRDAGLRHRVAGNVVGQTGVDGRLPGNVGGLDFLDDVPADDVINVALRQGRLVDEALDGEPLEIDGEFVLVNRRGLRKGQSHAADDDDVASTGDGSRRKESAASSGGDFGAAPDG